MVNWVGTFLKLMTHIPEIVAESQRRLLAPKKLAPKINMDDAKIDIKTNNKQ